MSNGSFCRVVVKVFQMLKKPNCHVCRCFLKSASGKRETSFAEVFESPGANRVTSCPRATNSSVSHETTNSRPFCEIGGTLSWRETTWAILSFRFMSFVGLTVVLFPVGLPDCIVKITEKVLSFDTHVRFRFFKGSN